MIERGINRDTFWNRNFIVALLAYLFLYLSVSLFFLLPLFLEKFGPSGSRVGLIMGIHSVLAILVRPFFGRIIDVRGGKTLSLAGLGLLILTTPLFHLVHDAGLLAVVLRGASGIGWGVAMTASISVCSDFAPEASLARSMGIIGVAGLVANALGPWLAEEIIRAAGFGGLFNAALASFVLSLVLMLFVRERPRERQPASRAPAGPGPLKKVAIPLILIIAAMPIIHGAVRGTMIYFIAPYAKAIRLGRVGPFFLVFSFAAILTRFTIADLSDRYGRKRIVLVAAAIIGLNLALIASLNSYGWLLVSGFVGGLGQGLIYPALSTYIIDFLGRENKGLAISLYLSLFDVGMGIGSPFFGWISDLVGFRTMYLVAGAILFATSIVFTLKAPKTPTDK
jgi:MFS family permease